MKKIDNIEAGLNEIENIDRKIVGFLEKEDYSKIIDELKNRLIVISQLTQLKEKNGIFSDALKKRFEKIFLETSLIETKIQEKKENISKRLEKHRKNKLIYKGRSY
jgi:predicted nucleotide-binding protein (sugar kinase/HSP70/actin superfamily)